MFFDLCLSECIFCEGRRKWSTTIEFGTSPFGHNQRVSIRKCSSRNIHQSPKTYFSLYGFASRFANSINYTALRTSPSVLMTWTEHNVNNQTRCGIIKYTLKTPTLDNIEDIFDYSYLQHDINTLFVVNGKSISNIPDFTSGFKRFWVFLQLLFLLMLFFFGNECTDYHVVGCGDRTVSMWDHRNGNLLIDIEIELPTIGYNIGCYSVGDEVSTTFWFFFSNWKLISCYFNQAVKPFTVFCWENTLNY